MPPPITCHTLGHQLGLDRNSLVLPSTPERELESHEHKAMSNQPQPPNAGSQANSFFSKSGSIVAIGFGFVSLALLLIGFSFGTKLHLLRREYMRDHPGQTMSWREAIASSGGWWGWVGAERYNNRNSGRTDDVAAERRRRRAEKRKKLRALPVPTFWEVEVDEDGKQGDTALGYDEDVRPMAASRPPQTDIPPFLEVSYLIRMPTPATAAVKLAPAPSKQKAEFQHLEQAVSSVVHHARFADGGGDDDEEDRWADLPYVELGITQMVPMLGDEEDDDEEDFKGRGEQRRRARWADTGIEGLEGIQRVPGVPTGAD